MQKNIFRVTLIALLTFCLPFLCAAKAKSAIIDKPEVKAFIQHMVDKHDFNKNDLTKWFKQATVQTKVLDKIAHPYEALPWHRYQPIFMSKERIQEGALFWKNHEKALARAKKEYGIPPEIIVAIIGVETFYGKKTGDFPVLDSLITLGFYYPPRSKFFISELEHFLLLTREEGWDPRTIKGSYAGAMGYPQFISSSYRKFATDFDDNKSRDLHNSSHDSIGSVANYFKSHGWKPGELVAFPVHASAKQFEKLAAPKQSPKPSHTLSQWSKMGIEIPGDAKINEKNLQKDSFALISLKGIDANEYWLGSQNFYVITRYNHSDHYAMAVYTLSEKIKKAHRELPA